MKNKLNVILETERLLLRYQTADDIEPLISLWTDPSVTEHSGGPRDADWLKGEFESTALEPKKYEYDLWPVIEKSSGKVVGHCGYLDKDIEGKVEIEINYYFLPSAWGKGYATEISKALISYAFSKMELDRLIALIKPENESSAKVAEKIGMKLEKQIQRPGGETRDVYVIEK